MTKRKLSVPDVDFQNLIYDVRGQKVMLDSDLARIYGVKTERFNQQVARNSDRFPIDFRFRLTRDEYENLTLHFARSIDRSPLKSQTVISKPLGRGGRRYLPYAFTEHGAIMAANVLRSPQAVQMSVFVVRAFVRMRSALMDSRDLARKLVALENELKGRLDLHDTAIVTILQRVMDILDPPPLPVPKRRKIGFREEDTQ